MSATTASDAASQLRDQIAPVALARSHAIPVTGQLRSVMPDGLPRGSTVSITTIGSAGGTRTLALSLVAQAVRNGGWVAMVGFNDLGMVAAAELGVPLERCVSVLV